MFKFYNLTPKLVACLDNTDGLNCCHTWSKWVTYRKTIEGIIIGVYSPADRPTVLQMDFEFVFEPQPNPNQNPTPTLTYSRTRVWLCKPSLFSIL